MAELKSTNVHPERLPGTWCVTLATDDDCRLAFNLPDKAAAEAARAELAPRYPGQRLDIGFFPTSEQLERWAKTAPVRVEVGDSIAFVHPNRAADWEDLRRSTTLN